MYHAPLEIATKPTRSAHPPFGKNARLQHIQGRLLKTTCPQLERLFTRIFVTKFTVRILGANKRKQNNTIHKFCISFQANECQKLVPFSHDERLEMEGRSQGTTYST